MQGPDGAEEAPQVRPIFLDEDAAEAVRSGAVIPIHVDKPFSPIIVMEKGGVEAGGVEEDGLRPRSFN